MPSIKLPTFKPKMISLPKPSFGRGNKLFLALAAILLAFVGLVSAYYFIPKATVSVTIQARPITETINITLKSDAAEVDLESSTVPAKYTSEEVSGEDSVPVTGTKTIGDPAVGEVTIYNRTSLPKTLLKGTTLTASSLKFTLNSDVTVASKSAGADYVDVPGKATAKITASAFGTAGNLKSGTEFTIASFTKDSFVAKNDSALTGGTSQEVTVVAESDKAALLKALKTKLSEQLKDSFLPDQSSGQNYFIVEEDIKVVEEKYSSKVGEAANSLSADVTLSAGVLSYSQDDIQKLVKNTISSSVPSGYSRTEIPPTVALRDTTVQENGDVQATADVTLYVIPSLDTSSITQTLKGKKYGSATSFLASIPGVVGSEITLIPNLPPRLVALPHNASRITLEVVTTK